MTNRVALFIAALLLLLSCNNKSVQNKVEKAEADTTKYDENSLVTWLTDLDTVNHDLLVLTDKIYNSQLNSEQWDSLQAVNEWHRMCSRELLRAYDATHSDAKISPFAKCEAMLDSINAFADLIDESTVGMIVKTDIHGVLTQYRQATYSLILAKKIPEFEAEMIAWNRLQHSVLNLKESMIELTYYGGTIRGPLCSVAASGIHRIRVQDLKLFYEQVCLNSGSYKQAYYQNLACDLFYKTVEQAFSSIEPELTGDDIPDYASGYKELYQSMKKEKAEMLADFKVWLQTREDLMNAEERSMRFDSSQYRQYENNTTLVIQDLAQYFTGI